MEHVQERGLDARERQAWIDKCKQWRKEAERLKRKVSDKEREARKQRERVRNVQHCLDRSNQRLKEATQKTRRLEALQLCVCRLNVPDPVWTRPVSSNATQTGQD